MADLLNLGNGVQRYSRKCRYVRNFWLYKGIKYRFCSESLIQVDQERLNILGIAGISAFATFLLFPGYLYAQALGV